MNTTLKQTCLTARMLKRIAARGAAVGMLLLLASCATFHLEPVGGNGVAVRQYRASKIGEVTKPNYLTLTVMPGRWTSEQMDFWVTVVNRSNQTIHISDTDFNVMQGQVEGDWAPLGVYQSDKYVQDVRRRYNTALALSIVGAVLGAASAGYHTEYESGSYSGSVNGNYYSGYYSGSRTYYDPSEAAAVNAQNAETVSRISHNSRNEIRFLQNHLFYAVDLPPGKAYTGLIVGPSSDDNFYDLVLTTPSTRFSMVFRRVKDQ